MTTLPQYSSFWIRLGAVIIDGVIVSVLGSIVGGMLAVPLIGALVAIAVPYMEASGELSDTGVAAVAITAIVGFLIIVGAVMLIQALYYVLFTGLRGQTPGKMLVGIKVVDGEGAIPGVGRAIMREVIGKFISAIVFDLGYLWVLWDPNRQAWHDKIAGTFVVPVLPVPPVPPVPPVAPAVSS